jgi:hypothetical protein
MSVVVGAFAVEDGAEPSAEIWEMWRHGTLLILAFMLVALMLAASCGDDGTEGVAGQGQGTDLGRQRDLRPRTDADDAEDSASPDDLTDAADVGSDDGEATDLSEPDAAADTGAADTEVASDPVLDEGPVGDADATADGGLPDATDDCEPLGIPEQWSGTFDGEVTSNIPDMAGYTFNGPVNGEIAFEIRCVNEKLMVFGNLDGGSTNCALATGCPFTARLEGLYDPVTQHMEGEVKDAVIDYSMVQVYAEGVFAGDLSEDPSLALTGTWSGDKTGISLTSLSWVTASGEGTWNAEPSGS